MKEERLEEVLRAVERVEEAGEIEELEADIAAAMRGRPADPRDVTPVGARLRAARTARTAARLLGLPHAVIEAIAARMIAPPREEVVARLILNFSDQLNTEVRSHSTPRPTRPVVVNVRRRRAMA